MRLQEMSCPNCNGLLDIDFKEGTEFVFCPYCGQKFWLDHEKNESVEHKNISITQNIHTRHTDDAEVIKAKKSLTEQVVAIIAVSTILLIIVVGILVGNIVSNVKENAAKDEGKISAGFYGDLIGEDYKTVKAHFEAAGFTDIKLIDLRDSGLIFWKNGKVETISIGGDINFESSDYFAPDTRVVISYH